jgi:hypothetical protein
MNTPRASIVIIVLLVLAGMSDVAFGSCASAYRLTTKPSVGPGSYIWTEGYFIPSYVSDAPPHMYSPTAAPPVTFDFGGVFWALGHGHPDVGTGDDSGALDPFDWFEYAYNRNYPNPLYYAGVVSASWDDAGVDGCVEGSECTAVLLSDRYDGDAHFALVTALNTGSTTYLTQPGTDPAGNASPIILRPIPAPIADAFALPNFDLVFAVTLRSVLGALYEHPSCASATAGYRIFAQRVPSGAVSPDDRDPDNGDWFLPDRADGSPQELTPLDQDVRLLIPCEASNDDVIIAVQLEFDSEFKTPLLSADGIFCTNPPPPPFYTRFSCGHTDYPCEPQPCADADADGLLSCAGDCDDANPGCTVDCTDGDGDGFCVTSDCDDTNGGVHEDTPEINDGLDNTCPGSPGYGLIDEISGLAGFPDPADPTRFSWPAQNGATAYEVARAESSDFLAGCTTTTRTEPYWIDTEEPGASQLFFYLVRPLTPNPGSWGAGSSLLERTPACSN